MSERTGPDNAGAAVELSAAAAPAEHAAAADVSGVPVLLSAREAAAVLSVNERTVRRAIQKGEIRATKHAGAFQITSAELEAYRRRADSQPGLSRAATPDRTGAAPDDDVLQQQTTRTGQSAADAVAVLRELLAEERRKSDAFLEASLVWQTRALQLQERLAALEAGPREHAPRSENEAPQRGDVPFEASQTVHTQESAVRRWWRRVTGR